MEDLKIGLVVAQIINFSILIFMFKYFLGDKIVKAIEERKRKLQNMEKMDSDIRAQLDKSEKESEKILKEAIIKAKSIIDDAEKLAKTKSKAIVEKAQQEAKYLIDSGMKDIEKERLSMFNGIKGKVTDLILNFNKKLFGEEKLNRSFVEKELSSIK